MDKNKEIQLRIAFRRTLNKMVKEIEEHPDAKPLIVSETTYVLLKEVTIRIK